MRGGILANVQRVFSSFPSGAAGFALLVFRASIAASLPIDGPLHWTSPEAFFVSAGLMVFGILLVIGCLTPYVSIGCVLIEIGVLLLGRGYDEYHVAHLAVNTGVLAVLGPGAYSIDARVFGRQVLNIPSRH